MKKFLSMMLALVMCLSLVPSAFAAETAAAEKPAEDVIARFIPETTALVTHHAYDDMDAVKANIRHMLKSGLTEVKLAIDLVEGESLDSTLALYGKSYGKMLQDYTGLVYAVSVTVDTGSADGRSAVLRLNSGIVADEKDSYTAVLTEAMRVHDELWASGAINSKMTQKQKAKVYFDWLVEHCEYDFEVANANQHVGDAVESAWANWNNSLSGFGAMLEAGTLNAWGIWQAQDDLWAAFDAFESQVENGFESAAYGAFIRGKATCGGYTAAYNLLLRTENIDCTTEVIEGYHEWTVATLDGVVYHIDATWGDQHNVPANQYFCMTPEASWARFPAVTW